MQYLCHLFTKTTITNQLLYHYTRIVLEAAPSREQRMTQMKALNKGLNVFLLPRGPGSVGSVVKSAPVVGRKP